MPYKKYFLIIPAVLIIGAIFIYGTAAKSNLLLKADVFISSDNLFQADTLLVVVKNEANEIAGNLGRVKLHFFRNEDNKDWVAIVGMPVNKNPGNYKLAINVAGKTPFQKDIKVSKKDFPVKSMVITPKLSQKGYTAEKIINTIKKEENKKLNAVLGIINPKAYFKKPFAYPLSEIKIVGDYGEIRKHKNYQIQHLGVDLKAPMNTPIYAINNGEIVFESNLPDYGNTLIIDHGLGVYSIYLHLSDFKMKIKDMAKQGDLIGLSGDSGYAIVPHLHFSVKVRGDSLDPLKFIQATQFQWQK